MARKSIILFTLFFGLLSISVSFANEPKMDVLSRYSAWSNWFDETGKRIPQQVGDETNKNATGSNVNISSNPEKMETEGIKRKFDFIRETQSYDYSKDMKKST